MTQLVVFFVGLGSWTLCFLGFSVGSVPMGDDVPMSATMYPICSFQMLNVLLLYTLSDLLRVAPVGTGSMGTRPSAHSTYSYNKHSTVARKGGFESGLCFRMTHSDLGFE